MSFIRRFGLTFFEKSDEGAGAAVVVEEAGSSGSGSGGGSGTVALGGGGGSGAGSSEAGGVMTKQEKKPTQLTVTAIRQLWNYNMPATVMSIFESKVESAVLDAAISGGQATVTVDRALHTLTFDLADGGTGGEPPTVDASRDNKLFLNFYGRVTRHPVVGSYKTCDSDATGPWFVSSGGQGVPTHPGFIPAWAIPEIGDNDEPDEDTIVLQAKKQILNIKFSYLKLVTRVTIDVALTLWALEMPSGIAASKKDGWRYKHKSMGRSGRAYFCRTAARLPGSRVPGPGRPGGPGPRGAGGRSRSQASGLGAPGPGPWARAPGRGPRSNGNGSGPPPNSCDTPT